MYTYTYNDYSSLSPGPSSPRRGLVHMHMCKKFSAKASHTYLSNCGRLYWSWIQSFLWNRHQQRCNLQNPAGILIFQTWQYHFPNVKSNRKVTKSIYPKRSLVATEILSSLRTQLVAASPWTQINLYNRNSAHYSLSKQRIAWSCMIFCENAWFIYATNVWDILQIP